jgi:Ni/Co efflux regulator RcnB
VTAMPPRTAATRPASRPRGNKREQDEGHGGHEAGHAENQGGHAQAVPRPGRWRRGERLC